MTDKSAVHVWSREKLEEMAKGSSSVKSGDVVKIVDHLSLNERAIVDQLRALGPFKVLDAKASCLEEMAKGARCQANVVQLTDAFPFLVPDVAARPARPPWSLAIAVVACIAILVLLVQFQETRRPTLPREESAEVVTGAFAEPSSSHRTQKGRAER